MVSESQDDTEENQPEEVEHGFNPELVEEAGVQYVIWPTISGAEISSKGIPLHQNGVFLHPPNRIVNTI